MLLPGLSSHRGRAFTLFGFFARQACMPAGHSKRVDFATLVAWVGGISASGQIVLVNRRRAFTPAFCSVQRRA